MTISLLHYDDDPFEIEDVRRKFQSETRYTLQSAMRESEVKDILAKSERIDVALLDAHSPLDSHELAGAHIAVLVREMFPESLIIMRSGDDASQTITSCLKAGADDFLSKKLSPSELVWRIDQSLRLHGLRHGQTRHLTNPEKLSSSINFVGSTLKNIEIRLQRIIDSAVSTVFVTGESGTGKEAVVDILESLIGKQTPLVRVNCGAINPSLLESELFGHARGAFTGAFADRQGLIETADGGWLFLDEIATLTPSAQIALLRAIENQEIRRVGASKSRKIQVRFISATNEDMDELVKLGRFRNDLWQRLCDLRIQLPPLRERIEEIPSMIEHFCAVMPGGPYQVTQAAMSVLSSSSWAQGNIRQLRNTLRAMTELHINKLLTPISIPKEILFGNEPKSEPLIEGMSPKEDMDVQDLEQDSISPPPLKGEDTNISVSLTWNPLEEGRYPALCDKLLVHMIVGYADLQQRTSIRGLARLLGFPRTSLGEKLKDILRSNNDLPEKFLVIMRTLGL